MEFCADSVEFGNDEPTIEQSKEQIGGLLALASELNLAHCETVVDLSLNGTKTIPYDAGRKTVPFAPVNEPENVFELQRRKPSNVLSPMTKHDLWDANLFPLPPTPGRGDSLKPFGVEELDCDSPSKNGQKGFPQFCWWLLMPICGLCAFLAGGVLFEILFRSSGS